MAFYDIGTVTKLFIVNQNQVRATCSIRYCVWQGIHNHHQKVSSRGNAV